MNSIVKKAVLFLALVSFVFQPALQPGMSLGAAARTTKSSRQTTGTTMPMMLVVPLFISDEHFASQLVLVNAGAQDTYADVTVRATDGTEITTQRVQLASHNQHRVDIEALLESVRSTGTKGSIVIMPSSDKTGGAVAAQLTMTYLGSAEPNYIDEEVAMPTSSDSQELRGVADAGEGSPAVAITSLADSAQHVTIQCFSGKVRIDPRQINLAPGATVVTAACGEDRQDAAPFDRESSESSRTKRPATGISLVSDGMPGSFAAFALAPHQKEEGRYFSSVAFTDPMMVMSPNTVFTGIPVGSATALPGGNYVPEISLANFSAKVAHVQVRYSQTSGNAPSVQDVKDIILSAKGSMSVALRDLQGDPGLQNSFIIVSDGMPGDVLAKLVSKSEDGIREVESLGKDQNDPQDGGNHPWSIEHDADSTLLLFNTSAASQYFNVMISGGGVTWQKAFHLQPMQTVATSIRNLVESQVKDDTGKILPKKAQNGQVTWYVPAHDAGRGRVLESNPRAGMARSFSCGGQIEICQAGFYSYYPFIGDNETVTLGNITAQVCMNQCNGTVLGNGGSGYTYSWSSGNSGIASISGPTNQQSVSVYGVSPGTTYLDGSVYDGYCQLYVQPPAPVVPTLTVQGNQYGSIFVGTDPGLAVANTFTANVNPTGGTLTVTSSDSKDTFTYGSIGNTPSAVVTTPDQSATTQDRIFTFKYTVSGQYATQTMKVTAREFAYATNPSLSNICSRHYGYQYSIIYTPYTHPDKTAVQPGIGVDGTVVSESFNPSTISCGNVTGSGGLDANSEFTDNIAYCSDSPLPPCSSTNTQTLKVGGYLVRTNSLTNSNTGLTYSSQGPTQ